MCFLSAFRLVTPPFGPAGALAGVEALAFGAAPFPFPVWD